MTQELVPNESDRILCVKVGKVKRENLYEMTRKYWKVNIFQGEEDEESDYIGKSVVSFYGRSQNPVKYINI